MSKKARSIMIQGTMSGAGKSLLCTAICRIFSEAGIKTAPFKSQNMALNSYVTDDGSEIGRAQAVQAQAARIRPDARMNPILLKPCSDHKSQIIVGGKVYAQMDAVEYYANKNRLVPHILDAYQSLASEYELIVIEGAGSPAEINLKNDDIVNMGLAKMVDAPVLLAGDIDRGGVFAQLYGTWALLDESERERVKGFVINKFRGDKTILDPGLTMLADLVPVPVLGVIPYMDVDIDDEDSVSERLRSTAGDKPVDIAVIRLPRISNFTDLIPLEIHPMLGVRYVRNKTELGKPDMIILPGTKSTVSDLLWLRESGLENAILKQAGDVPILGICGGYQMMGEKLFDPDHIESEYAELRGMGLLPAETHFVEEKTTRQVYGRIQHLSGEPLDIEGYEIHMGQTDHAAQPFAQVTYAGSDTPKPDGCICGNRAGTYLHGLFDNGVLADRIARFLAQKKGCDYDAVSAAESHEAYAQRNFDILARTVKENLDMKQLNKIIGKDFSVL